MLEIQLKKLQRQNLQNYMLAIIMVAGPEYVERNRNHIEAQRIKGGEKRNKNAKRRKWFEVDWFGSSHVGFAVCDPQMEMPLIGGIGKGSANQRIGAEYT